MRKRILQLLAALLVAAGAMYWFFLGPVPRKQRVYLDAAFSPQGDYVYYLQRDLTAIVDPVLASYLPFGSPYAHVRLLGDSIAVTRVHLRSGRNETLAELPAPPWVGSRYTSRPENVGVAVRTSLGWSTAGELVYSVAKDNLRAAGVWKGSPSRQEPWTSLSSATITDAPYADEHKLHGTLEVIARDGSLLVLDHAAQSIRALAGPTAAYAELAQWSRRGDIERTRTFRLKHEELVRKFKVAGEDEGTATLLAYRELGKLGLMEAEPAMVARQVETAAGAVYELEVHDLRELLPHAREALEYPGRAAYKPFALSYGAGTRDVDRLNPLLADARKGARYYVRFAGRVYELTYE